MNRTVSYAYAIDLLVCDTYTMIVIHPYLLLVILSHETLYLHRAKISVKLTISCSKSYGENRQNH